MSKMGVLVNEDPMGDALALVRGKVRPSSDTRTVGADHPNEQQTSTPALSAAVSPSKTERWLALERERREIETRLKTIASQQDGLRQEILGRWSMNGTSSEKVDGATVHLQRKVYPKPRDGAALAMALRKEGLDDLLTVDTKAFTAWVNECVERDEALPDSIAAHLGEEFERFALVVKLK